jgi:hypothetical protein
MVVALIALFVALAGSAFATTSALITGRQIANGSVTGLDVKNKSLTPLDFKGSVRGPAGPRGATGFQGPQGLQGAQGPKGDPGAAGATNVVVRFTDETSPNLDESHTVVCQGAERATGGGFSVLAGDATVTENEPSGTPPSAWRIRWDRVGAAPSVTMRAWVVCASP